MEFKKLSCFLKIIFVCAQIYAGDVDSYNVQKKILIITDASEPQFIENYILFTFKSKEKTFFVGAAFDFDNYVKIHQFKRNQEGIYILALKKPEKEVLNYRLVVDGLWMADPFNPIKIQKPNAVEISVLNIADNFISTRNHPFTENGITYFRYKGEEGKSVYLAGNFNKWDPFMYHMTEKKPGEYFTSIKLPPGTYNYHFVVNGRTESDIDNPKILWDKDYREISTYSIR